MSLADVARYELLPTPTAGNFNAGEDPEQADRGGSNTETVALLGTPSAASGITAPLVGGRRDAARLEDQIANLNGIVDQRELGPYAPAIARWEEIIGAAPAPTKPGRNGRPKLNPAFAEWMMGAPVGWITDTPGVTDNEALRMAGNGVVQQQAEAALRTMLNRSTRRAAA